MLQKLLLGSMLLLPFFAIAQIPTEQKDKIIVRRVENVSRPQERLKLPNAPPDIVRTAKDSNPGNKKEKADTTLKQETSDNKSGTKKSGTVSEEKAPKIHKNVWITTDPDSLQSIYRRDYVKLFVDSLFLLKKYRPKGAKIILYIDDIPFEDLEPQFINDTTAVFLFQKNANATEANSNAWIYFYKKPKKWRVESKSISLGYTNDQAVNTEAKVNIVIYDNTLKKVGIAIIIALTLMLILLGYFTDLLRDEGTLPAKQRPYSLARTQFAIWSLLISSAYIFLWISTGELPVLTNSTLILLGISGGTSIAAKLIDNSQSLTLSPTRRNQLFIIDILSDENGVSIHRLQMMVFTIVTGLIFCYDVPAYYEMPDFDSNLLILMGISSGTYAGFKVTENNPSTPVG